jgi:hypothetical protein
MISFELVFSETRFRYNCAINYINANDIQVVACQNYKITNHWR